MGKLSDILNGTGENLKTVWQQTKAADDWRALPAGEYTCRAVSGELQKSKSKGTPSYKLTLEVADGDLAGRKLWHDFWLTAAALPMTKRDLAKLGVTTLEQLEQPLPAVFLLRVKVTVRKDDEFGESNRIKSFELIGTEPPDAFAPPAADEVVI